MEFQRKAQAGRNGCIPNATGECKAAALEYVHHLAEMTNDENLKEVALAPCENAVPVEKPAEKKEQESLIMDFSTAFKSDTRRGKGKKGKKKVSTEGKDEADPLDDVNKDLEDENILEDDSGLVIGEIPRNLTITQE